VTREYRSRPDRESGARPSSAGGRGRQPAATVSLARALSKLGWCSRAEARVLIEAGRVTVDTVVERDADARVDMRRSRIAVDGSIVRALSRVYLMLHKPRGWVTSTADEHGRSNVYELLPDELPRVVAVGRLDLDSEGVLLFTNDTRWADRVADPRSHIDKLYHVRVARAPDEDTISRMLAGVEAGRGEVLRLKSVRPLARRDGVWLEVVIDEGRNRQIRRVFEAVGGEIQRLVRVAIGPVRLGDLGPGMWRILTREEREALGPEDTRGTEAAAADAEDGRDDVGAFEIERKPGGGRGARQGARQGERQGARKGEGKGERSAQHEGGENRQVGNEPRPAATAKRQPGKHERTRRSEEEPKSAAPAKRRAAKSERGRRSEEEPKSAAPAKRRAAKSERGRRSEEKPKSAAPAKRRAAKSERGRRSEEEQKSGAPAKRRAAKSERGQRSEDVPKSAAPAKRRPGKSERGQRSEDVPKSAAPAKRRPGKSERARRSEEEPKSAAPGKRRPGQGGRKRTDASGSKSRSGKDRWPGAGGADRKPAPRKPRRP
jgi:23S rRNA pseudouridine2605 synthase